MPVNSTTTRRRREIPGRFARAMKRDYSDYTQVFTGTGTGPSDRDGSIQGTAYLTFTLIPNTTTYEVATDACQNYCDGIETCGKFLSGVLSVSLKRTPPTVFVNLYYGKSFDATRLWPLLNWVFSFRVQQSWPRSRVLQP